MSQINEKLQSPSAAGNWTFPAPLKVQKLSKRCGRVLPSPTCSGHGWTGAMAAAGSRPRIGTSGICSRGTAVRRTTVRRFGAV